MLLSARFAGDPVLEACLNGTHRMLPFETGPAVGEVQRALLALGYLLPVFGADETFGTETATAVTRFKTDEGIEPNDGVVGVQTMAALDSYFVDEDAPPPPPPVPPPPPDPFGRRPSAVAKLPVAAGTVAAFAAKPGGSPWLHLDRTSVASGITAITTFPDSAQQGGNGLCTTAAFANIWAQDAPDAYAAFAAALFDNGAAELAPFQGGGGTRITASPDLMAADYGAIAVRMRARGFPVPSQADWMVFSAIRDSSNMFADFTGDPDDWVSSNIGDGAMGSGDLVTWMRSAGAWAAVVDEENEVFHSSLDHAKGLDPSRSRCVLSINSSILTKDPGGHSVVLRSPVTDDAADGSVSLKVWTWASVRTINATRSKFERAYFGAVIGFL